MKLYLRDRNQGMVDAWKVHFKNLPNVDISQGDIFTGPVTDAIVSPSNGFAFMNGGIDLAYSERFGWQLSQRLQKYLVLNHDGELPVGEAVYLPITDDPARQAVEPFKWLISAPTMRVPLDISGTVNAYLAFRAVLRLVKRYNEKQTKAAEYDSIRSGVLVKPELMGSVLCPGLGTAIGRLPYNVAAYQMREAYRIVMENQPLDFSDIGHSFSYHESMRRGLPYREPDSVFGEN